MTEIQLTKGFVALVDDEDLPRLQLHKWHSARGGNGGTKVYATTHHLNTDGSRRTLYMHRFILNAPKGSEIDHINGNPLDNRKANLRFCTRSENMQNVVKKTPRKGSRFMGVVPHGSRWKARAGHKGKTVYLGLFLTEEEAGEAYLAFVKKTAGSFAARKLSMTPAPAPGTATLTILPRVSDSSETSIA